MQEHFGNPQRVVTDKVLRLRHLILMIIVKQRT